MGIKKTFRRTLTVASLTGFLGACAPAPQPASPPTAAKDFLDPYVAHKDERSGLPTFVWLNQRTAEAAGKDATAVAWRTVQELAPLYQMNEAAMKTVQTKGMHNLGHGSILVKFAQQVDGLEVFLREVTVAMDQSLRPVAASGHFAPTVRRTAVDFKRPPSDAIAAALQNVIGGSLPVGEILPKAHKGSYTQFAVAPVQLGNQNYTLAEPARTKQVLYPSAQGLVPAYYVELAVRQPDATVSWQSFVISAADNAVLFSNDLTANDAYNYRVWADANGKFTPHTSPYGEGFLPHPTGMPDGSLPTVKLDSNLVNLQSAPFSKNDPWLPAGATEAKGNNSWAYGDITDPDGFNSGDLTLPPSAAGTFDYSIDPEENSILSDDGQRAGIAQLFYTVNYMHDAFYDAGYDEKAGNPQLSNYGRGGIEGDPIKTESQDSSGLNNANCSTPADGSSPRIQMYAWNNPTQAAKVVAPAELAGSYPMGSASFGPTKFNLTGDLVIVDDGTAPTSDACQPITNMVAGKIAVIDRGTCSFAPKAKNAQDAGAIAVIIVNNAAGGPPGLGNTVPPTTGITIPTVSLSQSDGALIKAKLTSGTAVQATITPNLRNGSLDNIVIAHEWGHSLSNRLIGNAGGLSTNQSRGLGEGWSDIVALVTLVRPEAAAAPANANWNGTFAVGQFDQHLVPNSYYYGIRRYPYSADMTKNPLTYKYISDGVTLPTMPPPAFTTVPNSEVHNTGEIWASMVWDCYTNMLRDTSRYTFAQAQKTMTEYLVASMKLTPLAPTLLEARDALLATMYAHDQKDFAACADSFARRKAGTGAVAPDRNSTTNAGAVESDKLGPDIILESVKIDDSVRSCDKDGILDNAETGRLSVVVRNPGTAPLTDGTLTITSDNQNVIFANGTKTTVVAIPRLNPYQSMTVPVDVQIKDATTVLVPTLHVAATSPSLVVPKTLTLDLKRRMNYDVAVGASTTDIFGVVAKLGWTSSGDTAVSTSATPWTQVVDELGEGIYTIPDNGVRSDQYLVSPPIVVDAAASFGFTIKHRYSFETDPMYNYDGAVVELSADNGMTWTDIGSKFLSGGYNDTLSVVAEEMPAERNPLIDPANPMPRPAFVKMSPGYPAYGDSTADLGTAYAGKTVRLRFRVGTDPASGAEGWQIDQISVTGVTNKPFAQEAPQPAMCTNLPPVVTVTPTEQTVPGGRNANLQGTVSDPENDSVVYEWVQLSGPIVALPNPTSLNQAFTVPSVTENVEATFALRASDGKSQSEAVGKITFAPPTEDSSSPSPESQGCGCRTAPVKTRTADIAWDFLWVALAGLYCHRRRFSAK